MSYVNDLLKMAVELNASDIFITVGVPPVLKINGELIKTEKDSLSPKDSEQIVKELFAREEHFNEYIANGEKDFSISQPGLGRFRINAYMQRGSMAAAIRVVKFDLPDAAKLGIPQVVLDFHKRNKGLILVTGPTGSGKSTTLSAIINTINTNRSCHILTLEDPIEFLHRHNKRIVNQREIGLDTKGYSNALRSALRQSPDVILVGEMRDLETMSIALTAAETGHLVLSTLHTMGASKTIDRIIDVFPPNQQQQVRVQLSTLLQAVVTQQLVPSKGKGLVAVFEIMIVNSAIRNLIRDGKTQQIDAAIQTGRSSGMISMDMSLADLYKNNVISKDDAITYCVNQEAFMRYIS
jgi:twitching motility protein PilT